MSKIHLEIFDKQRTETFKKLKVFGETCYLAGGTALALQIGHRHSFDFDLFIPNQINNSLLKKVREIFGKVRFSINTVDQITFVTKENISVTFLAYWFPLLKEKITTTSVPMASLFDIIADKAQTIGRRAVWRDYADIFYILNKNIASIQEIITLAHKKFGGEFVPEQFLEQLVYYDDVEIVDIDWIEQKYSPNEIKTFFKKKVQDYVETIKK